MVTLEIKNYLLPACQMYLRAKTIQSKEIFNSDYANNFTEVANMEIDDAQHMMKHYLRNVKSKYGIDTYNAAFNYCKELIENDFTKRTIISVFKNAKSIEPLNISLNTFLISNRHYSSIKAIREESDKDKKSELKKNLPCATISGIFEKRNIAGIQVYNGLVCLDFDGKDNSKKPIEIKEILRGFDEVLYCGLSVGGNGIFAIVKTDNTDVRLHDKVVDSLGVMFEKFGLKHDKGCKDVSRLRFISHDEDAYLNENAVDFQTIHLLIEKEKPVKKHIDFSNTQSDNDRTKNLVEKYVSVIQFQNIDLTVNYEDWVKIGFAIASHFGMDGEDYFIAISQNSPKFDLTNCMKKYEHFCKAGRRSGIGAFINICKSNNISIQ